MKKFIWVMMLLVTVAIYANPIKSIKRIDLQVDGVLLNGKEKLLFGMNEEEVIAILGPYESKGYGDLPYVSFEMLLYREKWGFGTDMIINTFREEFERGIWAIFVDNQEANFPLYIDGKKIYVGQDASVVKGLLSEYIVIESSNHANVDRIVYKTYNNYLTIWYDGLNHTVKKVFYGRYLF